MNRLYHLRQTLPKNIKDNEKYPNMEFVLLDYNSKDGTEEWIKKEMYEYLDNKKLIYYKVTEPKYFDRSHSRNILFRLASGYIICNLDADNYTGPGFAEYINDVFQKDPNTLMLPDTKKIYYYIRDAVGRFCAKKEDLIAIAGYDEKMSGYGFEDDDLYERLRSLKRTESIITDLNFLKAIRHDDNERVINEFYTSNIEGFYISYISVSKSEVLFLYKDYTFERGYVVPNIYNTPAPVLIENLIWEKGIWKNKNHTIVLSNKNGEKECLFPYSNQDQKYIIKDNKKQKDKTFYKITNPQFLSYLSIKLPLITNQGKFLSNRKEKIQINKDGFGKGVISKNFSETIILD